MGFFSGIKKAFKKVVHKVTGRGNSGQSAPEAPTPAPELEINAKEDTEVNNKETEKVQRRKGKKGLRISKKDVATGGSTGRNLV